MTKRKSIDWIHVLRALSKMPNDVIVTRQEFECRGELSTWKWALRERSAGGQVSRGISDSPWLTFVRNQRVDIVRSAIPPWTCMEINMAPLPAERVQQLADAPRLRDGADMWRAIMELLMLPADPAPEGATVVVSPSVAGIGTFLDEIERARTAGIRREQRLR